MNIYSLLNIEHYSNLKVPDAKSITTILNDTITPRLNKYGLDNSSKKYIWQGNYNENGIKPILQFSYRGTRGSFWIGVNFNFIPFITQNKALRYYTYNPHLFESKNFFDQKTDISLWNEKFLRKSLEKYFDKNLESIVKFFDKLKTIEANIEMAKRQIHSSDLVYDLRSPKPKYVLIFLYNKADKKKEMLKLKDEFMNENKDYNNSIFSGLD